MKILIIPDIHGRDFWIEPCSHIEEYDKIIFLGDYHDPYPNQVSIEDSIKMLKYDLLPFVNNNKDKVICLLGNHDYNYIQKILSNRVDYHNFNIIKDILKKINLKLIYRIDDYLFSHSGVIPLWLDSNNLTLEKLETLDFSDRSLEDVSAIRGGWSIGSCIFGDVREYIESIHIPNIYQIFGHTQVQKEFIEKDFACLDCKKCFILNTETKELKSC